MSTEPAGWTADDLRASVRDFRDPRATVQERDLITEWWASLGIPNQFAAMLRASQLDQPASLRAARGVVGAPPGSYVHHLDGDPRNNDPGNLVIVRPEDHA